MSANTKEVMKKAMQYAQTQMRNSLKESLAASALPDHIRAIQIPGPHEIFQHPTGIADKVLEEIAASLSDPKWVRDWRRGTAPDYHFTFIKRGTLSVADKRLIHSALQDAGWKVLNIRNSEETGERAGLFSVDIGVPPQQ